MGNFLNAIAVKISFQNHDLLKKIAGLFAGMGHMQPLLLATTNANYLLDRFCMERCCSSEYISRIVTSIIFMEILSIILVRIVLYIILKDPKNPSTWLQLTYWSPNWQGTSATGQNLNNWNDKEEKWRGVASSIILSLITLGYLQIFYAFTSGGRKGHMHWFYFSLLIQHFLNSLIAGSIGFWEVGLALWYLVTLPMAPIPVFFYQLIIHSWIRNNGPRYPEYIIVENQIWLALCLSFIATLYWIYAYATPYYPIELEIQGLNTGNQNPSTTDQGRITTGTEAGEAITLAKTGTVQSGQVPLPIGSVQVQSVELTSYSANLVTIKDSAGAKYITLTLKAGITIEFKKSGGDVTVTSADQDTSKPVTLKIKDSSSNPQTIKHVTPDVTVEPKKPDDSNKSVEISLAVEEITVTLDSGKTIQSVTVTIPVKIDATTTLPLNSIVLKLPAPEATDQKLTIENPSYEKSRQTLTINVQAGTAGSNAVKVSGTVFAPKEGYCIYSVRDGTAKDIWTELGGKCFFAACYKNGSSNDKALLVLYLSTGRAPNIKYFGKENNDWKEITKALFYEKLPKLVSNGQLEGLGNDTTLQYNRIYHNILPNVWLPLIMQGLSVGAVGSIFPNLIPKTLVCPKTTRNLSVINMFLVTVPHIFNVMLGDMDLLSKIGVGDDWTKSPCWLWPGSLSLYLIYFLAILFAIFNIHYPEWRLSCFLRNNTWFVFLMILFTDVLNETFNAISRAGICSQKAAGGDKKNHPCLHNKIACLMNLTYIPFWLTTTPMMKSYVNGDFLGELMKI